MGIVVADFQRDDALPPGRPRHLADYYHPTVQTMTFVKLVYVGMSCPLAKLECGPAWSGYDRATNRVALARHDLAHHPTDRWIVCGDAAQRRVAQSDDLRRDADVSPLFFMQWDTTIMGLIGQLQTCHALSYTKFTRQFVVDS